MPESTLISIIVPCYRAARTLPETLASIAAQTDSNWEVCIIDDGSPDDCAEIGLSWQNRDARFRVISKTNGGLSSARNRGISEARGDWLLFLDADDLIAPGKLEAHRESLVNESAASRLIPYGGCRYFRDQPEAPRTLGKDGSDRSWMPGVSGGASSVMSELAKGNIVPVSAPLVPTRVARTLGGFDETLRSLEDWDFWIRCTMHGCVWWHDTRPSAETWIRLLPDSMSTHDERMFNMEVAVRLKHRTNSAMRKAWRQKRRFQMKAIVANIIRGQFRLAARRLTYLRPY